METTQHTWHMSALEFTVLWHAIGRDVLPYPLHYRSTEDTAAAYERAYKKAAARLRVLFDEDMYGPLRILTEPEARIEVAGFANAYEPVMPRADAAPTSRRRIHAAVAGPQAVLLFQEATDPGLNTSDYVTIKFVRARTLARRIFAFLGDNSPGTGPEIRIDRAALESEDDTPLTRFADDAPRPALREARRFFERPRSSVIHFAVYPGAAYDHRAAPARDFHLIDYPDGRYRVRATATVHAVPTTTADLATHLQNLLDRTLSEHREDHEM